MSTREERVKNARKQTSTMEALNTLVPIQMNALNTHLVTSPPVFK